MHSSKPETLASNHRRCKLSEGLRFRMYYNSCRAEVQQLKPWFEISETFKPRSIIHRYRYVDKQGKPFGDRKVQELKTLEELCTMAHLLDDAATTGSIVLTYARMHD
jgi:hypothetical protein